jgi:hypothetical protein
MGTFADTSDEELQARLNVLLTRLDEQLKSIAPVLVKVGRDREEAAALVSEMKKRGLLTESGKDATSEVH